MQIALDAMGGDHAPGPIVAGAVQAVEADATRPPADNPALSAMPYRSSFLERSVSRRGMEWQPKDAGLMDIL